MTADAKMLVRAVAVFISAQRHPVFEAEAEKLGREIALRHLLLIFGAGGAGLMGATARGAYAAGGQIFGVAPVGMFLDERTEPAKWEEQLVRGMHARKDRMYQPADAFIVGPGGLGTLDECFESSTWSQLGIHHGPARKPIVLLNWSTGPGRPGFFDYLIKHLDHVVDEGLLSQTDRDLIQVATSASEALDLLGVPNEGPGSPMSTSAASSLTRMS